MILATSSILLLWLFRWAVFRLYQPGANGLDRLGYGIGFDRIQGFCLCVINGRCKGRIKRAEALFDDATNGAAQSLGFTLCSALCSAFCFTFRPALCFTFRPALCFTFRSALCFSLLKPGSHEWKFFPGINGHVQPPHQCEH